MPDAVEVSEDGRAAFMVADGQPAWHGLGQLKEEAATVDEALDLSHLRDWDVHKVPIYGQREDKGGMAGRTIPFKDEHDEPFLYGSVRTNPFTGELEGLGTVGKLWTPVQNEELAELGDLLINEAGAHVHTMGSLEGGRRVFMSFKLPDVILVGGEDAVDEYLVLANAHDGTGAIKSLITNVRVVCKNTLDMAIRGAKQSWSVRHVGDVKEKVEVIKESLELVHKYQDRFIKTAEGLLRDPFSDDEMQALLKELVPDPKSEQEGWIARAQGQRTAMMSLFQHAETTEFGRGTKWAAYNAVAEYADWQRPGSPERRAREALGINVVQHLKPQALKALVTVGGS